MLSPDLYGADRLGSLLRGFGTAVQAALGVWLLCIAVMLIRSHVALVGQDVGVNGGTLLVAASYPRDHVGAALAADISGSLDSLRLIPGVTTVGAAFGDSFHRSTTMSLMRINGRIAPVTLRPVTPGYLDTIGVTWKGGRALNSGDAGDASVVVNAALVRQYYDGASPLGTVIGSRSTVVGVVNDVFEIALDEAPGPTVYSLMESPGSDCVGSCPNSVSYVLAPTAGGELSSALVQRALFSQNADAVVSRSATLHDLLRGSVTHRTLATLLLSLFATMSVLVAATTAMGGIALQLRSRTREIAVRRALGATSWHIGAALAGPTMVAATCGIAGGAAAASLTATALAHLLYGVAPSDARSIGGSALLLVVVLALGCAGPIWKLREHQLLNTLMEH